MCASSRPGPVSVNRIRQRRCLLAKSETYGMTATKTALEYCAVTWRSSNIYGLLVVSKRGRLSAAHGSPGPQLAVAQGGVNCRIYSMGYGIFPRFRGCLTKCPICGSPRQCAGRSTRELPDSSLEAGPKLVEGRFLRYRWRLGARIPYCQDPTRRESW